MWETVAAVVASTIAVGTFLFRIRKEVVKSITEVRDELRRMNGQIIALSVWRDEHEKAEKQRLGTIEKNVADLHRHVFDGH